MLYNTSAGTNVRYATNSITHRPNCGFSGLVTLGAYTGNSCLSKERSFNCFYGYSEDSCVSFSLM